MDRLDIAMVAIGRAFGWSVLIAATLVAIAMLVLGGAGLWRARHTA